MGFDIQSDNIESEKLSEQKEREELDYLEYCQLPLSQTEKLNSKKSLQKIENKKIKEKKKLSTKKSIKDYKLQKAEQFLTTVLSGKNFEDYSVILNKYYDAICNKKIKSDLIILSTFAFEGAYFGITCANLSLKPIIALYPISCCVIAGTLVYQFAIQKNMHNIIKKVSSAPQDTEYKTSHKYIEGQENTFDFIGNLTWHQFYELYEKLDKKFNITKTVEARNEKIEKYLANDKAQKAKKQLLAYKQNAKKYNVQVDDELEKLCR